MPDTKVSDMTALTGLASAAGDLLPIIDVSETGAAKNKSITRDQLRQAINGEVRAADFVTTIASASAFEQIFTGVPCTSGKTYRFEVEFWVTWATAAVSGNAVVASSRADPGTPTMSANRMIHRIGGALVAAATSDTLDSANAEITAASTWEFYESRGFFTATSSDNFNWGILVAGWDAGDVVTIAKGAKLLVQQVD